MSGQGPPAARDAAALRSMRVAAAIALAVMCASLAYGFTAGDFWGEGAALTSMVWGQITLIEAYLGYAMIAGWMLLREASRALAATWIVGMLALGHVVSIVYVLLALRRARGSLAAFWLGADAAGGARAGPGA